MTKRILLSSPHMSEEGYEKEFINVAFESNWIAPLGSNVDGFEADIKSYTGSHGALAVSSGTAAIHLALKLAGVQQGDIVMCQSLTFAASANPIAYLKAKPVFIDSEYSTWNMDPELLEKALIKHPGTKAVIIVHLYGIPAKINIIKEICDRYDVILIEDAAESLGSFHKGVSTGTIGQFGILSFNGNKIITTSGGGMLLSHDIEPINKARFWATQAREDAPHYQHEEIGYNYRLSNVSAGIGRGQMKVLQDRVSKKQFIFNFYERELSALAGISFMPNPEGDITNCWLTAIQINCEIDPYELMEFLEKNNVESRPVWKPMHLQPVFKDCEFFGTDVSETLFNRGLCLPSDSKMSDEELQTVCDLIKEFWKENA